MIIQFYWSLLPLMSLKWPLSRCTMISSPGQMDSILHFTGSFKICFGAFSHKLNNTDIALVPKKDNPSSMIDLRPISLCNVVYNFVSKVLANRVRNAIVAIETVHHIKCKTQGKNGELALKIDIGKVFDKLEWNFLIVVLLKFGFDPQWVSCIRICIEIVNYNVLINGDVVGPITP